MSHATKIKHVSDYEVDNNDISIRKPFKIHVEEKRRFIRIEISSPVAIGNLKDNLEHIAVNEDIYTIQGNILNISPGGVLIDLSEPLFENDIVLMKFTLQDDIKLNNVLGMVKRVENDQDTYLTGVEFISRKSLEDRLSQADLDSISNVVADFETGVKKTLEKYVYQNS